MTRKSQMLGALLFASLLTPSPSQAERSTKQVEGSVSSSIVIPYEKFGSFENIGKENYRYVISNRSGLSNVLPAGVYPNDGQFQNDAEYKRLVADQKLEGPLEKFSPDIDPKLAYYKWASQKGVQNQGLRLYNIARSFEAMGRFTDALAAYHAVVVHFPKSVSWQDGIPWYIGVSSLDAVRRLVSAHPEWNVELADAELKIQNGFDQKGTNDVFFVNPGHFVAREADSKPRATASHARTLYHRGGVKLVRWSNGDWQLMVHDRPFLIRGVSYVPTPVGQSPDYGYKAHIEWMNSDENNNKRIDGPYDAFVDANGNNKQDADEPSVGDFRLMSNMGVNTVRLYHHGANKALLRDLSRTYGIRVLMGDLVGAYAVGSGAQWETGTDYSSHEQRERMRESVRQMVEENKDEDYVLMWVLGNENNYGHGNSAAKDPETYFRFINSLARMIHIIDPSRPVAVCNGDMGFVDVIARECPDVDVLAINAYRGENGMGDSFWANLRTVWNKAVMISEFGCPAYNAVQNLADAQKEQAAYLLSNWADISGHAAGVASGNAIGGVVFEWVDEWWKAGSQFDASIHDKTPQSKGPFRGGYIYEEWLGLTSNGNGEKSPFLRQLRPAYFALKNGPWSEPMNFREAEVFDAKRRGGAHEN